MGAVQDYDIPAGSLASALNRLANQSGLVIVYGAELTSGLSTPGLQGSYTPDQVLQQLLAGTGLNRRYSDANTVTLVRAAAPQDSGPIRLEPLVVEGALREDPRRSVDGYRATRSVTATRLDTPLDELPVPVQVLPREVIEDINATRLEDVVRLSTGGAIGNDFGGVSELFLVRGFESSVVRNGAAEPLGAFQQTDTANIERVEVLRGPASALYGQGAPGGVVNVVTKRPTDSFFAEFASEASSFTRLRQDLDVNLPLAETWNLSARMVGALEWTDSFRLRDDFDETLPEDRQFLAPSLSFSPTPTTDIVISGEALWSSDVIDRGVPLQDNGSLGAEVDDFFGDEEVGNADSRTLSAQIELTQEIADGLSLRLFGSAIRNDFEGLALEPIFLSPINIDAATAAFLGLPGPLVAGETLLRGLRDRDQKSESYTFQSDLNGQFSTGSLDHDVLLSFEYQDLNRETLFSQTDVIADADFVSRFAPGTPTPLTRDDLTVFNDQTTEVETVGLILYDQVSLFDRLHVLAGGRIDFLDQTFENHLTGSVTKIDETEVSPRVGAVLEPFADLPASVFVSYGESFEPNLETAAGGGVLAPQTGRVIEGGLRYGFNNDRLEATLTVFDIKLEDVPVATDFDFSAPSTQESRGIEISLQGAVTDNLSILASYAFTDAELTEVGAGGSELNIGESPPAVPKHSVNLLARYDFNRGSLDGLSLTGSLQYASRRTNGLATEQPNPLGGAPLRFEATELEPFVRVDIGVAYEFTENVRIEGGVQNLLNQEIANPSFNQLAIPEAPVTGFASLRIRF